MGFWNNISAPVLRLWHFGAQHHDGTFGPADDFAVIAPAAAAFSRFGSKLLRDEVGQEPGKDQRDNPKHHVIGDVHVPWLRISRARVKTEFYGVILLGASHFLAERQHVAVLTPPLNLAPGSAGILPASGEVNEPAGSRRSQVQGPKARILRQRTALDLRSPRLSSICMVAQKPRLHERGGTGGMAMRLRRDSLSLQRGEGRGEGRGGSPHHGFAGS